MKVLEPDMIFPGEEIVHVTGYHWIYVLRSFLPFSLILIGGTFAWALVPSRITSVIIMIALIVSMAWIAIKVIDTIVKRCYVTNRRLINRAGWAHRDTKDVTLDRIGGIYLDQTPLERFLGYGRVKLIVPLIEIELPEYLRNPIAFRNALYVKPADKPAEKPDDETIEAAEQDRLAKEHDDRFGAETVSLKELREAEGALDEHDLGANLGAELGADEDDDLSAEVDEHSFGDHDVDTADASTDGSDSGADGSEQT